MGSSLAFEEIFSNPAHLRSDLRLLERAVCDRWDIEPSAKRRIVDRLRTIVDDLKRQSAETSTRSRAMLRVHRVYAAMMRVDREDISAAMGPILNPGN